MILASYWDDGVRSEWDLNINLHLNIQSRAPFKFRIFDSEITERSSEMDRHNTLIPRKLSKTVWVRGHVSRACTQYRIKRAPISRITFHIPTGIIKKTISVFFVFRVQRARACIFEICRMPCACAARASRALACKFPLRRDRAPRPTAPWSRTCKIRTN
jgi:hypothetical protein